jgi:hypothetical protein
MVLSVQVPLEHLPLPDAVRVALYKSLQVILCLAILQSSSQEANKEDC